MSTDGTPHPHGSARARFLSFRKNQGKAPALQQKMVRVYDWRETIARIETPTLIAHGEQDLLDATVPESIHALIPNSEVAMIAHAGHMPFWEAPEEFFERVERFLNE
jgi:pimeloyl-ACP methyl ester carboxylesterase